MMLPSSGQMATFVMLTETLPCHLFAYDKQDAPCENIVFTFNPLRVLSLPPYQLHSRIVSIMCAACSPHMNPLVKHRIMYEYLTFLRTAFFSNGLNAI